MADVARLYFLTGGWARADELTRERGDEPSYVRAMRLVARGQVAAARGDHDGAESDLTEAHRYSLNITDPQFNGPYYQARALLALWEGDAQKARTFVEEGLEPSSTVRSYPIAHGCASSASRPRRMAAVTLSAPAI
jgi:hypothetical protein